MLVFRYKSLTHAHLRNLNLGHPKPDDVTQLALQDWYLGVYTDHQLMIKQNLFYFYPLLSIKIALLCKSERNAPWFEHTDSTPH